MLKNVTVTLEEEDLKWARRRAAEEETSVSRMIGTMIRRERSQDDSYSKALESWRRIKPWPIRASGRMSRDEAHERRR